MTRVRETGDKHRWGDGDIGTVTHCWWECKMVWLLWETVWQFLKRLNKKITIWFSNSISRHWCDKNHNIYPAKILSTNVHGSIILSSPEVENRPTVCQRTKTLPTVWSLCTTEHYSALRRKGTCYHTDKPCLLPSILPTARSQSPKGGHMPLFIWNV